MKLESWIREDMRKFIRETVSGVKEEQANIRREDTAYLYQMRYMQHIQQALKKHKLAEAKTEFGRLKQHYKRIPEEYSSEKKSLYRTMQGAYKLIYDYVSEQEKTQNILDTLRYNADVFDEDVKPVQLENELKKKKREEEKKEVETRGMMAQAMRVATAMQMSQPPPTVVAAPQMAQHAPQYWQPPQPMQPPPPPVVQAPPPVQRQEPDDLPDVSNLEPRMPQIVAPPVPDWNVEDPLDEKQVAEDISREKRILWNTAKELIKQAEHFLDAKQLAKAQEKLIEARVEVQRFGGDTLLERRIRELEQRVASMLATTTVAPEDRELFSSLYLRGLQALQKRDYTAAYQLFLKRVHQAPTDLAAKIRLEECREVLYGGSA